jgi:hypothetical protein
MTDEEKREIEDGFKCLRKRLDSPEGQAEAQVRLDKLVEKHAREHAEFLRRSRERSFTRFVRISQ